MCHVEKASAGAFIKTGFWTAPRRQLQTRDERYLSFYLLTCPERNSIGLFPLHLGEAAGRAGLSADDLLATLEHLVEQREIDMCGYWVLVRNWWDHNHRPGPGLQEKIERALADAPESLRVEWETIAKAAGVAPFSWQEVHEGSAEEAAGVAGGSTEGGTPDNYNHNGNHNSNSKNTTTTEGAGNAGKVALAPNAIGQSPSLYAEIAFMSRAAEAHRREFVRVCVAQALTLDEARQLALELCARVDSAEQRPEHRVEHPEPWLTGVVLKARAARAPILRQGIKYQHEAEDRERRTAKAATEANAAQRRREEEDSARAELTRSLQELEDHELGDLAAAVVALFPPSSASRSRDRARTLIMTRQVPSGLGGAYLVQALRQRGRC